MIEPQGDAKMNEQQLHFTASVFTGSKSPRAVEMSIDGTHYRAHGNTLDEAWDALMMRLLEAAIDGFQKPPSSPSGDQEKGA